MDGSVESSSKGWDGGGGVNEAAAEVDEVADDRGRRRDPCSTDTESFTAGVNAGEYPLFESQLLNTTCAQVAIESGGMSFVHDKQGFVLFG